MLLLQINWWITISLSVIGIFVLFFIIKLLQMRKMLNDPEAQKSSPHVKELKDANFKATIAQGVSLVDFWAPWCAPCRMQGPIVNQVAEAMVGKANICKLDVEQHKQAAAKYGVNSIPTIIIFKDGQLVKKFVGIKTKQILIKELEKLF